MNKKRKIELHSTLWNEDILYEIVGFIKFIEDFFHLAETCKSIYNYLLNNEIILNLIFKNFHFKKLPEIIPNYFYNLKYLNVNDFITIEQLKLFTKLEYLTLPIDCNININNLDLKNLKKLDISCSKMENINFNLLKENLEDLNILFTMIKDEEIKCLQNLTSINVSDCENIFGDCFKYFTKLKILKAKNINITELFLNTLTNLEYLNLSHVISTQDLSFNEHLINLENLKILKLKNTKISNGQYFEKLINLNELNLNDTSFDDITKLKLPKNLKYLSVSYLAIIDQQLQNLENLQYLDISYCIFLKGDFLKNLKNLERLIAKGTYINDENLSFCKKLQYLDILSCTFIKGPALLNLENLCHLKVNNVHDEHFNNLINLKYLEIRCSKYISNSIFLKLKNLKTFIAFECKNFNDDYLQELQNLKVLSVISCKEFTGTSLQYLNNLKSFTFYLPELDLHDTVTFEKEELNKLIEQLISGIDIKALVKQRNEELRKEHLSSSDF